MSYNESLKRNSNYPPMSQSEWNEAPWNEKVVPEKDFEVDVEFVMQKKNVPVTTNDYFPEYDEEDRRTCANTEDTNWENVYDESGHYTIPELLQELESYIKEDLERYKGSLTKEHQLKKMLESCQGWEVYDKTFTESE